MKNECVFRLQTWGEARASAKTQSVKNFIASKKKNVRLFWLDFWQKEFCLEHLNDVAG